MRIYYSLYDQILQEQRLLRAFVKVKSNKGAAGIDGQSVTDFAEQLSEEISRLVCELKEKSYRPMPVRRVEIPKPDGGVRALGIPAVRDRVVPQTLLDILQPIFDPGCHPSSYGYRPGRSCHQAIAKASLFIRRYRRRWVVDMDLSRCFDTLNHDLIIQGFRRKVADGSILVLLRMFLQSGIMVDGDWQQSRLGSPQGGVISPLIANVYLDVFDQYMKSRGHRIVRYADDILILSCSKKGQTMPSRWIRRRLRAKQLTLWKKSKRLHRRLRQLGYKGEFKAIKMNAWRSAASPLANYAIPNSWLWELGLFELSRVETGYLPQNY